MVWTVSDTKEDEPNLIGLSATALLVATLPAAHLEAAVARVESGKEITARTIALSAITSFEGDEDDDALTVHYKPGGIRTRSLTITLDDSEDRDEVLAALTLRLGGVRRAGRKNLLRSALTPLGFTAALVFFTWIMHRDGVRIAAGEHLRARGSGKRKLTGEVMHWLEEALGPTGVLIVGGLLIAVCLAWLYFKVTRKPIRVVVPPRA